MKDNILTNCNEVFELISDNPITGIVICDKEACFLFANPTFSKLVEYSSDELTSMNFFQLLEPTEQSTSKRFFRDLINGKTEQGHLENRLISKTKKLIRCDIAFAAKRKENRELKYLIAFIRDLGAENHFTPPSPPTVKQIKPNGKEISWTNHLNIHGFHHHPCMHSRCQELFKLSEEKLFKMFASNPSIICISNLNDKGRIIDCNDAFVQLSGYCRREIIGSSAEDLNLYCKPEDRDALLSDLMNIGRFKNKEICFRRKTGEIKTGLVAAETILIGGTTCAIVTVQDITENKEATERLKANERTLRQIIDLVPHFIYVKDEQNRFKLVNKALADAYGTTVEELLNKTDADVNPQTQEVHGFQKDDLYVIRTGQQLIVPSETITDAKGKQRILHTTKIPFSFSAIHERCVLGISIDITEQELKDKELYLAKRKAEESEHLKTSFLNNMSHEVRTPLNAIVGFSQLLIKPNQSPDKIEFLTELITESANQLIEVITDIIEISQIHSNQIIVCEDEVELDNLFIEVSRNYEPKCRKKNIEFQVKLQVEIDQTRTISDHFKLNKIFKQLIDNAVKFTEKGSISIGCHLRPDNFYEFNVTDTGIGIIPEMLEKIFDNFRQGETGRSRNFGGNGVGLSIAKAYVERLGGKIWLSSKVNVGSTLYFTIPYRPWEKIVHHPSIHHISL